MDYSTNILKHQPPRRGQQVSIVEAATLAKASLECEERMESEFSMEIVEEPAPQTAVIDLPFECFSLATTSSLITVGGFSKSTDNNIIIAELKGGSLRVVNSIGHVLPCSKLMLPKSNGSAQLLAGSSDSIRIWRISEDCFSANRVAKISVKEPVTSFDWDDKIVSVCRDGSAGVWEPGNLKLESTFQAHERGAYDAAWMTRSVFATAGEDSSKGSVKLYDIREGSNGHLVLDSCQPILRLAVSDQKIAAISLDSKFVQISDVRRAGVCVQGHLGSAAANCITWTEESLAVGTSDGRVLTFDNINDFATPQTPIVNDLQHENLKTFMSPVTSIAWNAQIGLSVLNKQTLSVIQQ